MFSLLLGDPELQQYVVEYLGPIQTIQNDADRNIISNPKQSSCKKGAVFKNAAVKRCKIESGGQEMAVMVG